MSRVQMLGNVLCLSLLASGCAAAQQSVVERDLREGAISRTVYRLPDRTVWDGIQMVLQENGYHWVAQAPRHETLETDWKCSGSACEALKVIVQPLGADNRTVVVLRTSYEGGQENIVPETRRAFDVEWSLLRQLDPSNASAVQANAKSEAGEIVKARADRWQP